MKRTSDGRSLPGTRPRSRRARRCLHSDRCLCPSTQYSVKVSDAQGVERRAMTPARLEIHHLRPPGLPLLTPGSPPHCWCPTPGTPAATTLGLKFTSSADGFIKGLRYYRDAANTGTSHREVVGRRRTELASLTSTTPAPAGRRPTSPAPVAIRQDPPTGQLLRTERALLPVSGRLHRPGDQHAPEHCRQRQRLQDTATGSRTETTWGPTTRGCSLRTPTG